MIGCIMFKTMIGTIIIAMFLFQNEYFKARTILLFQTHFTVLKRRILGCGNFFGFYMTKKNILLRKKIGTHRIF